MVNYCLKVLRPRIKQVSVDELRFVDVIFPVRDFFLLATAFSIGVWYRRNVQIHARAWAICVKQAVCFFAA